MIDEQTGELVIFYSRSNRPVALTAPVGDKEQTTFAIKIDKAGKKELKPDGKTNIYDKIQESKEATMIYNILDRYNQGHIEVLEKTKGTYGDFTKAPKSLAEAQQKIIDTEKMFMSLPAEIRKEFNNSTSEFIASLPTKKLEEIIDNYINKKSRKTKPELQEAGQKEISNSKEIISNEQK